MVERIIDIGCSIFSNRYLYIYFRLDTDDFECVCGLVGSASVMRLYPNFFSAREARGLYYPLAAHTPHRHSDSHTTRTGLRSPACRDRARGRRRRT